MSDQPLHSNQKGNHDNSRHRSVSRKRNFTRYQHTSETLENMEQRKGQTRRVLSQKERIEVINLADTLLGTRELARRFECGRTQILSILRQKDRLLKEWAMGDGDRNRLRQRPSAFVVAINRMVAEWINRCRSIQMSLSDRVIIEKARQAKKFFKYSDFRPNKRWLGRFKKRFRLDDVDLIKVDPTFSKSLKLSDIFDDIKDTLDPTIVETMADRESSMEYQLFLVSENNFNMSLENLLPEQVTTLNNEAREVKEIEDLTCQLKNEEKISDTIKSDEEALECLKKLEEYSMLKSNFRAVGLLLQLEKIYKGELEA